MDTTDLNKKIDEILDFCILEEERAARFHNLMAARMEKEWMKEVFRSFARDEVAHKEKLLGVKRGTAFDASGGKLREIKLPEYAAGDPPGEDISYSDALKLAIENEKATVRLYETLAEAAFGGEARKLFSDMAKEEAWHKQRFEIWLRTGE